MSALISNPQVPECLALLPSQTRPCLFGAA